MIEKVIEIIRSCCALTEDNITPESVIKELSLDSLSFVELVVKLEAELDIAFDDGQLNIQDYITVRDIIMTAEELIDAGQKDT